jgi:hypothetical protein
MCHQQQESAVEINGKPVRDGTKQIVFEITEMDCKDGTTKDPAACAAAIAIMHTDDNILSVRVHRSKTYIEYPTHWKRLNTTPALRTELTVFDRSGTFEPGTYAVTPPTGESLERLRKSDKKTRDKRKRHDNNQNKRFRHDISNIRPRGANR